MFPNRCDCNLPLEGEYKVQKFSFSRAVPYVPLNTCELCLSSWSVIEIPPLPYKAWAMRDRGLLPGTGGSSRGRISRFQERAHVSGIMVNIEVGPELRFSFLIPSPYTTRRDGKFHHDRKAWCLSGSIMTITKFWWTGSRVQYTQELITALVLRVYC